MRKRNLVMQFITEVDHLGNETYKKVTLKVRPWLTDDQLNELVEMYCSMTSNQLVQAIVVDTRVFTDEDEDLFIPEGESFDGEQPIVGADELEEIPDKEEVGEIEKIPDKEVAGEVEIIPDKEELEESSHQMETEGIKGEPQKNEMGWTSLWVHKTVSFLNDLFATQHLKKMKKRKLLGNQPRPLPFLLGRDWLSGVP